MSEEKLNVIIYSDGSSRNKQTGNLYAWATIVDQEENDLLEMYHNQIASDQKTDVKDVPVGRRRVAIVRFEKNGEYQNNSAELVAFVIALRIALYKLEKENPRLIIEIRSDSKLVVDSWSQGRVCSKTAADMDISKLQYINECRELRIQLEKRGGSVVWIPSKYNKSDIGYHRERTVSTNFKRVHELKPNTNNKKQKAEKSKK